MSISVEFVAPCTEPREETLPLLDANPASPLPSFETRLTLIATAILSYERFDVALLRHLPLAKQIIANTRSGQVSP